MSTEELSFRKVGRYFKQSWKFGPTRRLRSSEIENQLPNEVLKKIETDMEVFRREEIRLEEVKLRNWDSLFSKNEPFLEQAIEVRKRLFEALAPIDRYSYWAVAHLTACLIHRVEGKHGITNHKGNSKVDVSFKKYFKIVRLLWQAAELYLKKEENEPQIPSFISNEVDLKFEYLNESIWNVLAVIGEYYNFFHKVKSASRHLYTLECRIDPEELRGLLGTLEECLMEAEIPVTTTSQQIWKTYLEYRRTKKGDRL